MISPISPYLAAKVTPEKLGIVEEELGKRAIEFLMESNLIEGIEEIDYSLEQNRTGEGYYKAFEEAYWLGMEKKPLTEKEICRWQGWITKESKKFGHDIPELGIGRLRGADCPYEVTIADREGTPYLEVHKGIAKFLEELNTRLNHPDISKGLDIHRIDTMAWAFFTFEHIHPFVDGNGRSGRLLFPYIAAYLGSAVPHVSFKKIEEFYNAHSTLNKMRLFVAEMFKESVIIKDQIFTTSPSESGRLTSRVYINQTGEEKKIIEWHQLERAMRPWKVNE